MAARKTRTLVAPITGTGKRRRHNPERREFRGLSYRKGRRVRELRDALVGRD